MNIHNFDCSLFCANLTVRIIEISISFQIERNMIVVTVFFRFWTPTNGIPFGGVKKIERKIVTTIIFLFIRKEPITYFPDMSTIGRLFSQLLRIGLVWHQTEFRYIYIYIYCWLVFYWTKFNGIIHSIYTQA